MPFPTKSFDEISRRVRAHFRAAFRQLPVGETRFLGRLTRAIALVTWGLHKAIEDIDADIVPSPLSSTDRLTEWAVSLGLPDGAGGIGRLLPTTASGGAANLTGVKGTAFLDGSEATSEAGNVTLKLSGAVTIPGVAPGFGSVAGSFVAVTEGAVGNLPAGTVCSWANPPSGADATFVLTAPLSNGTDEESNAEVFARIQARLQAPPLGGSAEDLRAWLADVEGVARAYVYPRRSGTGTADVVIVAGESGSGRAPSAAVQEEASAALEGRRSVGSVRYNVMPPTMSGQSVRVRIVPADGYGFDWDDTAAVYRVDTGGYDVTDPSAPTLRLDGIAPDSLKTAIDNYINTLGEVEAPRLQISDSAAALAGKAYNPPIRAIAYGDSLGKTILTLSAPPDGWIGPQNLDRVYAYSSAVESVASSIIAYVDTLGPSRASGHADKFDVWPDTMTLSGLTAAAENALDMSGEKPIASVLPDGVTINGLLSDVPAADISTDGPSLLYVTSVVITA